MGMSIPKILVVPPMRVASLLIMHPPFFHRSLHSFDNIIATPPFAPDAGCFSGPWWISRKSSGSSEV
jgi:hypothetical protein